MTSISRLLYRAALRACPSEFRQRFGVRMLSDFDRVLAESTHGAGELIVALRESGDVLRAAWRQRSRRPFASPLSIANAVIDDFRFAARSLRSRPSYAATCIVTLTLAIAANAVVFAVVDEVLLKPLPFAEPDRLVALYSDDLEEAGPNRFLSAPLDFDAWKRLQRSFSDMVAERGGWMVLAGSEHSERIWADAVSPETFTMLGVPAAIGTTLTITSDDHAVVLSHDIWRSVFGADAGIVDRVIRLNDAEYRIVGVMPEHFRTADGSPAGLWRPLRFGAAEVLDPAGRRDLSVRARLRPGVIHEQAVQDVQAISAMLATEYPETHARWGAHVLGLQTMRTEDIWVTYAVLGAAGILVLLIACANLAGLALARGAGRQDELTLRAALGAGRTRIVRLLAAEGLLVGAVSAIAGLALATSTLTGLLELAPTWPLALHDARIDGRTQVFSTLIAGIAALAFSALPALRLTRFTRHSSSSAIGHARADPSRHRRFRRGLVMVQISMALALLVGTGLLVRSLVNIANADLGFDYRGVLSGRVLLDDQEESTPEIFEEILERVEDLPGVSSAALADALPMDGGGDWTFVHVDGERVLVPGWRGAGFRRVSPDYFKTLGIRRVSGRVLTPADANRTDIVVINEEFARTFLRGRRPLGTLVELVGTSGGERYSVRVVGVVSTVRTYGAASSPITAYVPQRLAPESSMSVVYRMDGESPQWGDAFRSVVAEVTDAPVDRLQTLEWYFHRAHRSQRFIMVILGVFATQAALLAAIGLYGIVAYDVAMRRYEIGVRMAIGATRQGVVLLVGRQTTWTTLLGVAIGLVAALPLARVLSTLSFGRLLVDVHWLDPLAFGAVATFVLLVGFAASWIPARRAAQVNPVEALRSRA